MALSWLEPDRLQHLVAQAFVALQIGDAEAFLLVFDQDAEYDSPNFLWFRSRFPRFLYIDRIVVASRAEGRGHARRMYSELFQRAVHAKHDVIVCEVNSDPPNPASDAFHSELGFTEIGTGVLQGGLKRVRYLARSLAA